MHICHQSNLVRPCKHRQAKMCLRGMLGQRRPRSDCASAQSDQGLRCPLTKSLTLYTDSMGSKCPNNTLRMRGGPYTLFEPQREKCIFGHMRLTYAQTDQSPLPPEYVFDSWLSQSAKQPLIRFRNCTGGSKSSLYSHVQNRWSHVKATKYVMVELPPFSRQTGFVTALLLFCTPISL